MFNLEELLKGYSPSEEPFPWDNKEDDWPLY